MKEKLAAAFCQKTSKAGRYADGGNLYFLVKPDGRKSWVFRFVDPVTGKRQDMGLGRFGKHDVTLSKAREAAADARALLNEFRNPIEERKRQLREAQQAYANQLTFGDCALRYIETTRPEWRNEKHAAQWHNTLETYAAPIWNLPVAQVDQDAVLRCLEPYWTTKTVTMTRVRQRIESVISWATVRHYRRGDNPARWKGHLDHLLPKPTKLNKVQHRAALPYVEVGQFMSELRQVDTLAARALELQILTATRPGEVVNARCDEFDLKAQLWTISAERMKANKEHEIPLPAQAVALLQGLPRLADTPYVFPGLNPKKP